MKIPITKKLLILLLISLCSNIIFSQDLRAKAEENPLSTVLYLLSTTEKDSHESEKSCLASSFAKVNKYAEIEKTSELVEKGSYVDENFILIANELFQNGKIREASNFVSFLLKKFDGEKDSLEKLLKILVLLGREEEARKIANQLNDYRIDAYFEIADTYLEKGNFINALKIIDEISVSVEKSKYDIDKAKLGLFYAKLGKQDKSLRFLRESLKDVVWTTGIAEYDHARIIGKVFEAYLLLGEYKLANEMLEKQGKTKDSSSLIQFAQSYLAKSNRKKADELLDESLKLLKPNEYGDSFDLGDIIKIYLSLGEIEKALNIAKNLTGSEYMRQGQLINIADLYIKKQNKKSAYEILKFALEQTKKINTDEEEDGGLWTSNRWQQAQYQSQIAIRLIDIHFDEEFLEIISQIKKPYLKALLLTEFVKENKKRKPLKKLNSYLEQALQLLQNGKEDVFDSNKYDVYAIVARSFAEIGMSEKANDVFAEVLSKDKEMVERGLDSYLLVAMCKIGVEFEKSGVKPNEKLKAALRNIIKNWENDEY